MSLSVASCEYLPSLTPDQLDAIPLPGALESERYHLERNNSSALNEFNSRMPEIEAMIENARVFIEAAEATGEDLTMFKKKPKTRGDAKFYTKVDKDGRRVVLEWNENGIPYGPGDWSTKFIEAIGCLVRNADIWNVAFSFSHQGYYAFRTTWREILRYFVLEDQIDRRWIFVRYTMHQKFKQYRERTKKKYVKSDKYDEDWQRIYRLPSTIPVRSFAYLLLQWKGEKSKAEAERNSANRLKSTETYYGGNVPSQHYRHTVGMAGGDASLSTTWQVLHTRDDMPEDVMQHQRTHWEHLAAGEQRFREENPDFPLLQTILPIQAEASIMQEEFPRAAAKGRIPLVGHRSSTSSRGSSSGGGGFGGFQYSRDAEELQAMRTRFEAEQERRMKIEEECTHLREDVAVMKEAQRISDERIA